MIVRFIEEAQRQFLDGPDTWLTGVWSIQAPSFFRPRQGGAPPPALFKMGNAPAPMCNPFVTYEGEVKGEGDVGEVEV